MFCKTATRTSNQQQRRPKARRQAGPEFVAQALGWVDFHKPAVQYLSQQAGPSPAKTIPLSAASPRNARSPE
jgi:hypothetical protein